MSNIDIMDDEYKKILTKAFSMVEKKQFGKACNLIKCCCNYKYFLNDIYYDSNLEFLCEKISFQFRRNISRWNKTNKLMFYDQLSRDSRVLSMHYVLALLNSHIEFIYVYYEDNELNIKIRDLLNLHNIKTYKLGLRYNLDSIHTLIDIFNNEKPGMIFTQCHIDDYIGTVFNYAIKDVNKVENYLINISDHTFWIGKGAYSNYIEFRNYGYTISTEKRNISNKQLVKLPYYALNSLGEYSGLNPLIGEKSIILSGGAEYKLQGKDDFFYVVSFLLKKYPNFVFLYLTNENPDFIYSKFDQDLQKRVIVEKERKDLDEVMKRSLLYVNTYPICGALMTLIAANNSLIPLTLFNEDDMVNDLRDFFEEDVYEYFLFRNRDDLINRATYYIENRDAYDECRKKVHESCINQELFNRNFLKLINTGKTDFEFCTVKINYNSIYNTYKKGFENRFPEICFSSRSSIVFKMFPISFIKGGLLIIRTKGLAFFANKVKKYLLKSQEG